MPPNRADWCAYDAQFVAVLARYRLPITAADHHAVAAVLARCAAATTGNRNHLLQHRRHHDERPAHRTDDTPAPAVRVNGHPHRHEIDDGNRTRSARTAHAGDTAHTRDSAPLGAAERVVRLATRIRCR